MSWTTLAFLLAYATPVVVGLPLLSRRSFPGLGSSARVAGGFAIGSILMTWWATTLSLLGVRWSLLTIGLPLLFASLLWAWKSRNRVFSSSLATGHPILSATSLATVGLAGLYLALALLAGGATSVDLFYFWGTKTVYFLAFHGFDATALSWRYALHAHSNYPPLLPATFVWAALLCGRFSWWGSVLSSTIWWLAAIPLIAALLRPRLGRSPSLAVAAFWAMALALSLAASRSGGNAEAPLLLFVTVAGAGVLGETEASSPGRRWLIALALAGAVVSKNEGMIEAALLVGVALATDLLGKKAHPWRRAAVLSIPPLLAYAPWLAFELAHGMPLSDPAREPLLPIHLSHWSEVGSAGLRNLGAGSWGLAWLLPLVIVILLARRLTWKRVRAVLPGLLFVAGMFAFYAFYYLHFSADPTRLIDWTLPRISQPALSIWILTAACLSVPDVDTSWQL